MKYESGFEGGLTMVYDIFANLTFALIELIAFEMILTLIFTVDENGIKFTLDFGFSQYISTAIYVVVFLLLGLIWFNFSNIIQDWVIITLSNMQWKIIPTFFMTLGFGGFWTSKIFLGRSWGLSVVWISMLIMFGGLGVLLLSYVI